MYKNSFVNIFFLADVDQVPSLGVFSEYNFAKHNNTPGLIRAKSGTRSPSANWISGLSNGCLKQPLCVARRQMNKLEGRRGEGAIWPHHKALTGRLICSCIQSHRLGFQHPALFYLRIYPSWLRFSIVIFPHIASSF